MLFPVNDKNKRTDTAPGPEQGENEPIVPLDAATLTPEQFEALKERAAKADENWDRLLRATAEFDNFRKRAAREKQDAIKFANENLMTKLIPVLESFDNALAAAEKAPVSATALKDGVAMVSSQLKQILQENGLEEVDALNKPFDPNFHEAIAQQESADVPEGTVLHQARKGYKLRERLLRAASVVVSKQPA